MILYTGKTSGYWSGMKAGLLNLAYPPQCLACPANPDENNPYQLCQNCLQDFNQLDPPFCGKCAAPLGLYLQAGPRCQSCQSLTAHFKRAFAATIYTGSVRNLIQHYKFDKTRDAVPVLTQLLVRCAQKHIPADIMKCFDGIVIAPSHPAAIRERGYSQMDLLAGKLCHELRLPYIRKTLSMRSYRPPQYKIDTPAARFRNVMDNFTVRNAKQIKGKSLLLLDDVMTTGATAAECSRMLKKTGAKSVHVLVIARAGNQ